MKLQDDLNLLRATNSKFVNNKGSKIAWIELLLKTPLEDYRKTIVNLILAPYLVNIQGLAYEKALGIIKVWLESCALKRKLSFDANSMINTAVRTAQKSGYKPMRLDTLKQRNPTIFEDLKLV